MNIQILKPMLKKFVLITISCVISIVSGFAQSASPQIECKIKNCLNSNQNNASSACDVANGNYIELSIHLNKTKNASIEFPISNMVNPNPLPTSGTYYLVEAIRKSDGVKIPVEVFDTGGSNGFDDQIKDISFQIPYSEAVRRAKFQAWWNKIKSNANAPDQAILAQRPIKDNELFKAMDQRIVNNQLGQFQIICSYMSNKPGTWIGQVASSPISINVVNKGTLLDKSSP